jgi:hypothetical protein
MSTARDLWLRYHPATRIKKINKKLVLPAFTALSDRVHGCIDTWYQEGATPEGFTSTALSTTFNFYNDTITFECWIKQLGVPAAGTKNLIYYRADQTVGFGVYFGVWIDENNAINVRLRIGGVHVDKVSTITIPNNVWCHIAVKYDSTNPSGAGLKIFRNGILSQSISQAGVISGTTGNLSAGIGQETGLFGPRADVRTFIDEIRFWHTTERTDVKIAECYNRHVNMVASDNIDDNLEYFNIDEAEAASTITSAFGGYEMLGGSARVRTDERAPIKFGGSFIVKTYSITLDTPCSIVFPVERPDEANYGLYVSYQDDDDNTVRFKLFSADPDIGTETIHIPYTDYEGERLPETFKFEFWNIDGEEEVVVEDDITINVSLVSEPITSTDTNQIVAATPTGNTTLAIPTNVTIDNPLTPTVTPSF